MSQWKEYSAKQIENALHKATVMLQQRDSIFLDPAFNINERSVTHRLGIYLQELFPEEHVDCEYNRIYSDDADEYIAKNIELGDLERDLTLKDTDARTVYPDIIVHRRNTNRNLLAIEVKMAWKAQKGSFDIVKAQAYKRRLDYLYSAYLVLGPGQNYKIHWIQ